jgi:hypothetical protein
MPPAPEETPVEASELARGGGGSEPVCGGSGWLSIREPDGRDEIDPVTSDPPCGPELREAKGLENGLSPKRLDSELHPALRSDSETKTASRSRAGERIGSTRKRICYSRGRDKLKADELNTAQVNKALSDLIP